MRPERFGRVSSIGLALVTLSLTVFGLTRPGQSAALVGETKQVALQPKGTAIASVFPQESMTPKTLAKAIATYERTIVSEPAPFDAWIEGDEKAISEEAKRGFVVFNGKAQCAACHEGWNFTNEGFQDIGLPSDDVGRGQYLPGVIKMQHAFKTPSLREITYRTPYMHDGSLATLEQVVDHYDSGGVDRPSRSDLMKPLDLTAQEKSDLVAFLKSLSSNLTRTAAPVLPR
jgi:cytochrome c peroxidase